MIFPDDYKSVGVKDREEVEEPVYFSTNYLIIRQGPKLYRVRSTGQGFMRETKEFELVASGSQIAKYPDKVDTRNRSMLIELASDLCKNDINTIIFQGPDEHITFVHDPDPSQILNIEILDVCPPDPPWLVYVMEKLVFCGVLGDLTVTFKLRLLDLRAFQCDGVYYPCRASGLGPSLDSDKVVHNRPKIVGCEVSREIFLETNPNKAYDFVNICPLKSLEPAGPFITRCCRSERRGLTKKDGHPGVVVHWGDSPWQVAEAIRCLVKAIKG
ncbi:MAG: hypothetical protein LUQ38_01410 [Methanotrichaceae archaeon]|nr:hypothetical protein [Methanotrichaceae archaeon]